MNPFDANERHRYIIESGGNPVSSADGKEKEIWVNSINIDIDTPILEKTVKVTPKKRRKMTPKS